MAGKGFDLFAKAVGDAIKRARERAGMTQEAAAHEAELSLRHYQLLESGRGTNATLKSLYFIGLALGTSAADIVKEAQYRRRA